VREVEHASFAPLVLSATGGMANEGMRLVNSHFSIAFYGQPI